MSHIHRVTVTVHQNKSGPPLDEHLGGIRQLLNGMSINRPLKIEFFPERLETSFCSVHDCESISHDLVKSLAGFKIEVKENLEEGGCHDCICAA